MAKTYLGDGVYVDTEYEDVILTTENGVDVTNRIVLEWPVYEALVAYVNRWRPIEPSAGDVPDTFSEVAL